MDKFKGKKIAMWRGGEGIGDMIQCTPLFSRIKKAGAEKLDVFCWPVNKVILQNNPHVDNVFEFDPLLHPSNRQISPAEKSEKFNAFKAKALQDYDLVLELSYTVEGAYMARTDFSGVYQGWGSLKETQEKARGVNWFEEMARVAGLEVELGDRLLPEFYFSEEENADFEAFRSAKGKRKAVFWNPVGSTANKVFTHVFPLIHQIAEKFTNTEHFVFGDFETGLMQNDRIHTILKGWPLRKIISLMRAVDLFVGCESSLGNAAGAFDIPKILYYTHAYPESIGKNFINHDYITPQFSPEECRKGLNCYPCYWIPLDYKAIWNDYRGRYNALVAYKHCMDFNPADPFKPIGFRCITHLPVNKLQEKIIKVIRGK